MKGMSSPEGQKSGAALPEDKGNFIDHSKSCTFLVTAGLSIVSHNVEPESNPCLQQVSARAPAGRSTGTSHRCHAAASPPGRECQA